VSAPPKEEPPRLTTEAAKTESDDATSLPQQFVDGQVSRGFGWFKAIRGDDALELIRANPFAYVLAAVIAHRARWRDAGFNRDDLSLGEAMLGDWATIGFSRQQGRTALAQLEKWHFATSKATSKGTIAKLMDSRLFEVLPPGVNQQSNQQPTNGQPTANHQSNH
jgi:hypothetical protein